MSKPVDSRSVSRWTITLDEARRPWQLVKRREEWANIDTGLRMEIGTGESRNDVILRATVAWDFEESDAVVNGPPVPPVGAKAFRTRLFVAVPSSSS